MALNILLKWRLATGTLSLFLLEGRMTTTNKYRNLLTKDNFLGVLYVIRLVVLTALRCLDVRIVN
jgi:hypothetical protein